MTPRNIAKSIAQFASNMKAEDIVVLDMRKVVNYCDYLVLCSGNTDRHVRAVADCIDEKLTASGINLRLREGLQKSDWIILDGGDVVAHIFQKRLREFYQLEYLWREAKAIQWESR